MLPPVAASEGISSTYSLRNIWVVSLALKLLLMVGYHSTDFDVHRNWLAITNNLPLRNWYVENTLQWTLDYPPFFAYFEWFISQFVPPIVQRDGCLDIVEVGQYGLPTVYFQRALVLLSELVLYVALQWYIDTCSTIQEKRRAYVVASSLVISPGLLIVDHMHFQYNGMMYGILVLCINHARLHNYLMAGFCFAVLLCFKHIYLYLAPAVFVFLLRAYCLNLHFEKSKTYADNIVGLIKWRNLLKLGSVVLGVFAIAFVPFAWYGKLPSLTERLFPFNRGLMHAYWAPNFWAIYAFVDRVLIQLYRRIPVSRYAINSTFRLNSSKILLLEVGSLTSATRGIVGDTALWILPNITPRLAFLLTLFYQIMALIPLFIHPTFRRFVGCMTLCGYASFLFGWHVHEKAVLLLIFPLLFLASREHKLLGPFNLLTSCAYVSLFPLIYTSQEWVIKVVYTLMWYIIYYFNFRKVVNTPDLRLVGTYIINRLNAGYILGLVPLVLLVSLIDVFELRFAILEQFEFLKLMFVSLYCAIGIVLSWNALNWFYFVDESLWEDDQ